MRRKAILGLLLALGLSACSSTQPGALAPAASQPAPAASTAATLTASLPLDGPVTASMAQLQLDGERFATLGDPAAPITLVEFSDYG